MARLNQVILIGRVANRSMEPRFVGKEQTDGVKGSAVLNFFLETFNRDDNRYYNLPVAVWGVDEVAECQECLRVGDLVLVKGELRYKFIRNRETGKMERIYTTVKAEEVEFISKKLKSQEFVHYLNEVKLMGNLVNDPEIGEEGFAVAIDRLYPSKEMKLPNSETTDYVTVVVDNKEVIKGEIKKGSMVIIEGELLTRKQENEVIRPTIVVRAKEIVGR